MSTLREIYRHSFPKRLRFDKASQILYAQCYSIAKQHRHKKYIPQTEIRKVLDDYAPMPGAPWLQLPVVRQVLFIRLINGIRVYMGGRSWLYNRNVEGEHRVITKWLEKASAGAASAAATAKSGVRRGGTNLTSPNRVQAKLEGMVEREKFEREVLMEFHVATAYQRMMRLGVIVVLLLCLLLAVSVNTDTFVYWYLVHYLRYNREEVLAYFRDITSLHTVTEVPPAYAGILPPPCVRRSTEAEGTVYAVNLLEFTHPTLSVTVFVMPCPQMGERSFFKQVGAIAEVCDSIVLEGVTFEHVDKLAPAVFFPLKENTFPALGVHHRFLDILRSDTTTEPPALYPAGAGVGTRAQMSQLLVPYELRCVYNPTALSATKGEARVGWGRLRQLVEEVGEPLTGDKTQERHVICLPWTVNQVVNIEASLIKYGFKVHNVYPVTWLRDDHLGEHFCDYFSIH